MQEQKGGYLLRSTNRTTPMVMSKKTCPTITKSLEKKAR
jgi:hypothetical protein